MARKKKCVHGRLKHPKGRRVCRKTGRGRHARRHGGKGGRNCRFGVVRRGRRKGQCLKSKRARRRRVIRSGYRRLAP